MPYNRFFISTSFNDPSLTMKDEEMHHMRDVMRLHIGDTIELINGKGQLAYASVTKIAKKELQLTIERVETFTKKTPFLSVALPLLRPSHFDWAVEKLVELGVDRLLLFPANLSERKEISPSLLKRTDKLIASAMKQSGRLFSPEVCTYSSLDELLKTNEGLVLWADESATKTLLDTLIERKNREQLILLSGPEKGWSKMEKKLLPKKGHPVLLSKNTLRAETAAILMTGIAQHTVS